MGKLPLEKLLLWMGSSSKLTFRRCHLKEPRLMSFAFSERCSWVRRAHVTYHPKEVPHAFQFSGCCTFGLACRSVCSAIRPEVTCFFLCP